MKKIFLILLIIPLILFYTCIEDDKGVDYITSRDPGTGIGWAQQRAKVNFKDSINLNKGWMIKDTVILTSAKHFNYLRGVTSSVQTQINSKLSKTDTSSMLSKYARRLNPVFTGIVYVGVGGIDFNSGGGSMAYDPTGDAIFTLNTDFNITNRSLGNTTTRVLKGWFTNLEITNLPTVGGGTLKSALSLTSTDVGLGNVTNKAQVEVEDSAAMLLPYGRQKLIIASLGAGVETNVTLAGVTTQPYSILIEDSNGLDITGSVKDSTAISGGTYHTWIYSTDALTDCKIKVLW
jgi:hypothetical protein